MKTMIYVTTNGAKVRSLQQRLPDVSVKQVFLDMPEPRSNELSDIAAAKARHAYERIKEPLVVLDAGFYLDGANGFPRTYVNFALDTIGLEGLLRLVDGKDRSCAFRECLVYTPDGRQSFFFYGEVKGRLAYVPAGERQHHHWSDLAQLFIPEGHSRTLAEFSCDEHREWAKGQSSAAAKFGDFYR